MVTLRYSRRSNAGIFNFGATGVAIEWAWRRLAAVDWV